MWNIFLREIGVDSSKIIIRSVEFVTKVREGVRCCIGMVEEVRRNYVGF